MSRKSNQTIFRLGSNKFNKWSSNYIEKTTNESRAYNFKSIEIEKFVKLIFQKVGLMIQEYKVFINNLTLNFHISYLTTPKLIHYLNKINKKTKFKKNKTQNRVGNFKKKLINLNNFNFSIKTFKIKKTTNKLKRLKLLKKYKSYLNYSLLQNNHSFFNNTKFIKIVYNSLKKFVNPNYQLFFTMKHLNKNNILKYKYDHQDLKKFKSEIAGLRKFKNHSFFKEGVNMLFNSVCQPKSSNIIASFLALNLQKLKRHKVLLGFTQRILSILIKQAFSRINGIKIEIRGRIDGAPRSKIYRIIIGNAKLQSLNSFIDYSQGIAYTNNGTLGVKVWTCSKYSSMINHSLKL